MRKNIVIMLCVISLFMGFNACKSKQYAEVEKPAPVYIEDIRENAKDKLDWAGTYMGTVPCAGCSGIETRINLNQDGTYTMIQKYIDKGNAFETKGTFKWNVLGTTVTLTDLRDKINAYYAVGENKLTQLDMEGNAISGNLSNNYILAKIDPLLVGKRWKLVELNGKPVEKTDAFLMLDKSSNTVSGNLGCNTFSGTYDQKTGNRIKFSQIISTLKMCINGMEVEDGLKKVLEMADNYNVSGKNMILNRARMAPLARFVLE